MTEKKLDAAELAKIEAAKKFHADLIAKRKQAMKSAKKP
jgi:hypothetical protein